LDDSAKSELIARARQVVQREALGVAKLAEQMREELVDVIGVLLACEGHVFVSGAGTSHAIAQRFAHLLSCSGTPAVCIDAADALHGGAGAITDRDILYVISKGGHTTEINQFVEIGRARGAKVVVQTESPTSPLGRLADVIYEVKAAEDIDPYGMIATGSSLVNCAACDVLCVLLLELRGYTREAFGSTHPGGAVGRKLARIDKEES
jgi:D-arabinose 5-phosphate isomerase GutQ